MIRPARREGIAVNRTQDAQTEENRDGGQVSIVISDSATDDVRTVFDVLRAAFTTDRGSADVPEEMAGKHPTAWTVTVDVSETRVVSGPVTLSAPVQADVQGGYWAVDRLKRGLDDAFSVRILGTVSGDQEEEVRLRLDNRPAGSR